MTTTKTLPSALTGTKHIDCEKVKYSSKKQASAAARGLQWRKMTGMHSYKCFMCGAFHISTNRAYKRR